MKLRIKEFVIPSEAERNRGIWDQIFRLRSPFLGWMNYAQDDIVNATSKIQKLTSKIFL
jgi:hypothetical protein